MLKAIIYIISVSSVLITFYLIYGAVIATKRLKRIMQNSNKSLSSYFDISINQLALIERDTINLKTVLVAANVVDAPESLLREAVEFNFKRGVNYIFLISKSNYENFRNTYYKIFEAYLNINNPNPSLLKLFPLEIEWGDRPYIFYEVTTYYPNKSNYKEIYGFVGDDIKKGIATHYRSIPDYLSFTLFNSIITACDVQLSIENNPDEFKEMSKVIDINSRTG